MKNIIITLSVLSLILAGLYYDRPVCIELTQKEIIIEDDSAGVFLDETPDVKIKEYVVDVKKLIIGPDDIPVTFPSWNWYGGDGARNLKEHIIMTHNIPIEKLEKFKTDGQLRKLHSYLHNGGKL